MEHDLIDVVVPGDNGEEYGVDERTAWVTRVANAGSGPAALLIAYEHPEWLPASFKKAYPKP